MHSVDTIVIGAGHAGLSISYYLKQIGTEHIVLEKGDIGSSWVTQRWDSFRFNTPNKYNQLPGFENFFGDEDGFCSPADFVSALGEYAGINRLPVATQCEVLSVKSSDGPEGFIVRAREKNNLKTFRCRIVIVASGGQNSKYVPAFSGNIPKKIYQIHACEYRKASDLPAGSVLVIGGAQSGVQITEDLLQSGRKTFLSTSRVPRVPRRYRKRDIVEWLCLSGFFNAAADPGLMRSRFPQISGTGPGGHTVSLQSLARKGAILTGSAKDAGSGKIYLNDDVISNIKFADQASEKIKLSIDEFIFKAGYEMAENDPDPDDLPAENQADALSDCLDLSENTINTIIWTCGFLGDFSYLHLPVFDRSGSLIHDNGISGIKGLYFIGIPWLRMRKSGIVMGIKDDAEFIIETIRKKKSAS